MKGGNFLEDKKSYTIGDLTIEHTIRYNKFDMRVKHFHNEYEIFYIKKGERLFFFDNRNFIAKEGDLILVNSNLIHMTKSISENDIGHDRIILYITPKQMEKFDQKYPTLRLVNFFNQNYGIYHLTIQQQHLFLDMYHTFIDECTFKKKNYKQAIELTVCMYLLSLTRDINCSTPEPPLILQDGTYKSIYEIADYLSQNYTNTFSLDDLSKKFYLSKYYICRMFKIVTGYTINEYINVHRIQKSTRLLEETNNSISQIAENVGYKNLSYFEKIFKSYMTVSPLQYRKTLKSVTNVSHTDLTMKSKKNRT